MTTYTYDTLDNLIGVLQGGSRPRLFVAGVASLPSLFFLRTAAMMPLRLSSGGKLLPEGGPPFGF